MVYLLVPQAEAPLQSNSARSPRGRVRRFARGLFQRGDSTAILTGRRPKAKSAESPLQFHPESQTSMVRRPRPRKKNWPSDSFPGRRTPSAGRA